MGFEWIQNPTNTKQTFEVNIEELFNKVSKFFKV
jgi:hypothetical protein